ncbi:MAG: VTC domain-containing protein [Actinomycetota bacterium]
MIALDGRLMHSLTLAEVVEGWSLQERVDHKYLVPTQELSELIAGRRADYGVLQIDQRCSFGYETVYFDTPDMLTYRQHAQGVRRRFKVRVRRYQESELLRLEIKTQGVRSRTVKYALDGADNVHGPTATFVRQSLDDSYGSNYLADVVSTLEPGLVMTYRRTTLVSLRGGERVTVDTGLSIDHHGAQAKLLPGLALVEVKSADLRSGTDRVLLRARFRHLSFSKYVAGIELTNGRARQHPPGLLRAAFTIPRHDHAPDRRIASSARESAA